MAEQRNNESEFQEPVTIGLNGRAYYYAAHLRQPQAGTVFHTALFDLYEKWGVCQKGGLFQVRSAYGWNQIKADEGGLRRDTKANKHPVNLRHSGKRRLGSTTGSV